MSILITGFEPFSDHAVNPTEHIARALDGRTINGVPVVAAALPVSRAGAWPTLEALIADHRPAVVLATGVSDRPRVSLERIGRNVDDYPIPDNAGARASSEPIVPGAPAEYGVDVDLAALRDALWLDGYESHVSDDAGTFLCNHVYYRLLHHAATKPAADYRSLFVHVPRVGPAPGSAPRSADPLEHLPLIARVAAELITGSTG